MSASLGPLDHRLRIEKRTSTPDANYGTPADQWTTFVTVWASVQDVLPGAKSNEQWQDHGLPVARRPTRVRMSYVPGITSAMRAVDLTRGNRVLEILTDPAEIGTKDGLEFLAADFTTVGNAR